MTKFIDIAYLFNQFSSLEILVSPIVAWSADAWTFMIWLAIICKHNQTWGLLKIKQLNM